MNEFENIKYVPDYAIVGFPKCATSFMFKRCYPSANIVSFQNREINVVQLSKYQSDLQKLRSEGKVVGIKSPAIIYNKKQVDFLFKSKVKIIISVRNPVYWLKSFYNFRLKEYSIDREKPMFKDGILSFEKIIEGQEWARVSIERARMSHWIQHSILSNSHYRPENVHWVIQEDFQMNHEKVYIDLMNFLGLKTHELESCHPVKNYEYQNEDRYKFFPDADQYLDKLNTIFKQEKLQMCELFKKRLNIDLESIWKNFYN